MITMHVPSILAMQLLDACTLQYNAKEQTNVSHLLAINHLDNVLYTKFFVMTAINAQPTVVMETPEIVFTLLSTVTITMHVPLILAILQVDLAYMSVKFVMIKMLALLIAATLALEIVLSLIFLLKRLQLNHQINVLPTVVTQLLESFPHQ